MKVFDIHAHIYPDSIALRATQAISTAYDGFPVRCDGRTDTLIHLMNEAGISACACHSVATTVHQVQSVNRFVLSASAANPGRMLPFGALHPDLSDPGAAVDALIAAGFKGIKLHPELQGFLADEPRSLRMFEAIGDRLPVLLHCGDNRRDNSCPERIRRLLRSVPHLRLICAHMGGWTLWERAAAALKSESIWVDTSSSLYALEPSAAVSIIRSYGVERVLFGTDYPVFSPAEELKRFLRLPLTAVEQERILWRNHTDILRVES